MCQALYTWVRGYDAVQAVRPRWHIEDDAYRPRWHIEDDAYRELKEGWGLEEQRGGRDGAGGAMARSRKAASP